MWVCPLISQGNHMNAFRLQLDVGASNTFHYNALVELSQCIEGCIPDVQQGRIAPNLDLSVYKKISTRSELKLGLTYHAIRFWEKGHSPIYIDSYQHNHSNNFLALSIGHRMALGNESHLQPFVENNVMLDYILSEEANIKTLNWAYKLKLGFSKKIRESITLYGNGSFYTAMFNFSPHERGVDYYPFAYGIDLGASKKI
jgi:hypothetical protein